MSIIDRTKMLTYLLLFTLIFSNAACKEESGGGEIEDPDVTLSIDHNAFDFPAEGGSDKIQITSNATWKLVYEPSAFCKPTIQTSKGDASVTLTATENKIAEAREMVMTLTSEGAEDVVITITQEAGEGAPVDPNEPQLADSIDPDNTDMRDLTSIQLSAMMGVGWNLGNSMEAITQNGGVLGGNETSWGNPVVTKELIDAVKAAGFNTIRIPVSWSHMFDDQDTYKIKYTWKLRVEEVVNYALDNDMYVIMNIHWDGGWMDETYYSEQDQINQRLEMMWKQIAVFFRDYNDHLLFAGTNEVHRTDDFDTPTEEYYTVQNSFNQTFVSTVRATGGRNTYRHLVAQGYNTNINHTKDFFDIPEDPTEDRLFVEVHYYDPYNFSLDESATGKALWGKDFTGRTSAIDSWGQEAWVDEEFGYMKTDFVDKGYPVILGEYGALLRTDPANATYEEHVQARNYYLNYVTKAALDHGMVPVYWDNGFVGNNGFGLFNRSTGAQTHVDAVTAIVTALD